MCAVFGMLALVIAFSWSVSATASPTSYPPSNPCVVSISGAVTAGTTTTVTGSDFAPNEHVTLTLHPGGETLASVTTSSTGTFSKLVAIPAGITRAHTIQADAASLSCSLDFTPASGVEGLSAANKGPTSGIDGVTATRGLASTGFATLTASAIGLALLAGGAMFLIVGRRRKA